VAGKNGYQKFKFTQNKFIVVAFLHEGDRVTKQYFYLRSTIFDRVRNEWFDARYKEEKV
jgi:hypothetical protein